MRKFLHILTVLMCVVIYSSTSNASPPTKPDKTPFENAERHYNSWRNETIDEAKGLVKGAFNDVMSIAKDYLNAIKSVRNTMYSSLPSSIQINMVSALASAGVLAGRLASDMAEGMTLDDAYATAVGAHEERMDSFNNLWDQKGMVTYDYVLNLIATERANNSNPLGQADSLMEAFYRMENAGGLYNLKVQAYHAWYKKHAPSQHDPNDPSEVTISDPIKPRFTKVGCFGPCSDPFDTFTQAEFDHWERCEEKPHIGQGLGWYSCATITSCPQSEEHWRLCPGTCREKFPPKKKTSYVYGLGNEMSTAHPVYTYVDNFPHEVICRKSVYDGFLNIFANCYDKYGDKSVWYDCEHNRCPKSSFHDDDDDSTAAIDTTDCDLCTDGCSACPITYACDDHSGDPSLASGHVAAGCGISDHYVCDGKDHTLQASCLEKNNQRASCSVTNFFACQGHTCEYPSFSPSASLNASSYSAGSSLTATVSTSGVPIYGAFLYVRAPGDTSTYGTKLDWVSGGTSTTSLDLSYTFPNNAASGSYQITVRVYPWNGNRWGVHKYIFNYVNVQ